MEQNRLPAWRKCKREKIEGNELVWYFILPFSNIRFFLLRRKMFNSHRLLPLGMQQCWLPFRDMYHPWYKHYSVCFFLLFFSLVFKILNLWSSRHKNLIYLPCRFHPLMHQKGWISWGSLRKWSKCQCQPVMWIQMMKWMKLNDQEQCRFMYS